MVHKHIKNRKQMSETYFEESEAVFELWRILKIHIKPYSYHSISID